MIQITSLVLQSGREHFVTALKLCVLLLQHLNFNFVLQYFLLLKLNQHLLVLGLGLQLLELLRQQALLLGLLQRPQNRLMQLFVFDRVCLDAQELEQRCVVLPPAQGGLQGDRLDQLVAVHPQEFLGRFSQLLLVEDFQSSPLIYELLFQQVLHLLLDKLNLGLVLSEHLGN